MNRTRRAAAGVAERGAVVRWVAAAVVCTLVANGCVSGSDDPAPAAGGDIAASDSTTPASPRTTSVDSPDDRHTATVDDVVVTVDAADLADGATLYAEQAWAPDSPVPVVGPVVELGTKPDEGLIGEAILEFPVPAGGDPDSFAIAYWDELLQLWIPYPTKAEGSTLVATTDHFSKFSVLAWRTWTDEHNPLTAFLYGARAQVGQRGTEPECDGDPPTWMGDPIVAGTYDDQLLVCVGSDGDQAIVKVANNRGIPAIVSSNHAFAAPPTGGGDARVRDAVVYVLGQAAERLRQASHNTLLLAGAEAELRFDRPPTEQIRGLGDPPTIRLDVDRDTRVDLLFLQMWLHLLATIGISAGDFVQYADCALALSQRVPALAAGDIEDALTKLFGDLVSCTITAVDTKAAVDVARGRNPTPILRSAQRVLTVLGRLLGRTLDILLVFDLTLDEFDDAVRADTDADVKLPLCGGSSRGPVTAGCDVVLISQTGVGTLAVGRPVEEQVPDPILGAPPSNFYEEPGGYAEIPYDQGSVGAVGRSHTYMTVFAPTSSQGVPIQTELGIGVGSREVDAVAAYPDAVQPCGPGYEINWGNVKLFVDNISRDITSVIVFAPGSPFLLDYCSLPEGEYVDF